ncbi:DUF3152 domain-containing protein [Catenuloplanes atrovinosus]|uniref:DUF3152 domain-containing protein n=1 Tax=Catenuloplanes atrovinosus TaxID=137266 RepID=A0AAE4CFE3_9ACTN|nr:DUF3152 domain-containing protein [Catenuloplanes atrovinosus]MDR7279525.1 hypothetical protein [Catenuloplanes atrovinosus]
MATPGNRSFSLGAADGRTPAERAAAAAAIRRVRLDPEERRRQRRDNFGLPTAPMSRALAATRAEGRSGRLRQDAGSVRIPGPARRPTPRSATRDTGPIRVRRKRRRTGVIALLLAATALVGVDLARGPDYRPVSAPGGTAAPALPAEPPTRSAEGARRAGPVPSGPAVKTPVIKTPIVRTPSATAAPPGGETVIPEKTSAFAQQGSGRFTYAPGPGPMLGRAGVLRRFHVVAEGGAGVTAAAFAAEVDRILGDPRSWIAPGQFRLQRVAQGQGAEFTIHLATPKTTERMCATGGLVTSGYTSCRLTGKVIINVARWQTAIPDYGAPLADYRAYAVNHEVGHQFGHGHEACPGPGSPAPVMQQQTYGLRGCLANAWPYLAGRRYAGKPTR